MNKVKIITDSTCDLSLQMYQEMDVEVIPFHVNFNDESFLDLVEMDSDQLVEKVKETKIFPKTAAASAGVFYETFKKYIDQGYDVLYLGIGSGLSGAFQIAKSVIHDLPEGRVFLVDSQNLSSGSGLLLRKAVGFRDQGMSAEQIKEEVEKIVPRVRSQFIVDTLEYLHRGGRCSGTARLIGTLLKMHPLIRVIDGKMIVAKKPRGTLRKAVDAMLEYFYKDLDKVDPDCIFITHVVSDENEKYIREKITPLIPNANIVSTKAGSVIGSHCGPKTIGILYIVNE